MAKLTFTYERDVEHAGIIVRTSSPIAEVSIRLGPFAKGTPRAVVTVNGESIEAACDASGDASWVWTTCDLASDALTINARAMPLARGR